MSSAIRWVVRAFNDLSVSQLYQVLQLRSTVFVVEQQCAFLDADGQDQRALTVMGFDAADALVATARIFSPEVSIYPGYACIGRVCSAQSVRRGGVGRQLMEQSIQQCQSHFGRVPIKIGAQLYLQRFYESFGFVAQGDVYDEDGIPHICMIRAVE